ncbi:MAG: hypothetical protein KGQ46_07650 [Hyphomicrobiales bacterium]|nr:hypothetical protein [Hyphomicrobiales bacterium]MDE2114197.1 hypothetical protein [Hyphomicrobiales bacterium]
MTLDLAKFETLITATPRAESPVRRYFGALGRDPRISSGKVCTVGNGRFHRWRTRSGTLCTFTRFRDFEDCADFTDCIVAAIVGAGAQARIIAAFERDSRGASPAELQFAKLAAITGVDEWQVHFMAADPALRRHILQELVTAAH